MTLPTYEKIRTADGRVAILKNPKHVTFKGIEVLQGLKCNREGETTLDGANGPYTEVMLFTLDEIKWRRAMVMSYHYGELVDSCLS